MTLVFRYNPSTNTVDVIKDGQVALQATDCHSGIVGGSPAPPADRTVSTAHVAKSHWSADPYTNLDLSGLVIVDGYLPDEEAIAAGREIETGDYKDPRWMFMYGPTWPDEGCGCMDLPGAASGWAWSDGTNGCSAYTSNPEWCDLFGDLNGEGAASDNCCACGGGFIPTASLGNGEFITSNGPNALVSEDCATMMIVQVKTQHTRIHTSFKPSAYEG